MYSIRLHRHRTSGQPMTPNGTVSQDYTPKQMEAQPMPDQPAHVPQYQQTVPQEGFVQQPMH